jgi:hypothetical protein
MERERGARGCGDVEIGALAHAHARVCATCGTGERDVRGQAAWGATAAGGGRARALLECGGRARLLGLGERARVWAQGCWAARGWLLLVPRAGLGSTRAGDSWAEGSWAAEREEGKGWLGRDWAREGGGAEGGFLLFIFFLPFVLFENMFCF